jgi:hypothetical protein
MTAQHIGQKQLSDCDLDEVLALCGGDAMAALRVVLIANAMLEGEIDRLKFEYDAEPVPRRLAS